MNNVGTNTESQSSGPEFSLRDKKRFKKILLNLIPKDGNSKGNMTLVQEFTKQVKKELDLKITDDEYWLTRDALIEDGSIVTGKGRGGSVRAVKDIQPVKKSKIKEAELYDPINQWIEDYWTKNYQIKDYVSEITANQGRKRTGGKWTRPDITLVAIRNYMFTPGRQIEVITFEIKNSTGFGVESVFETASHSAAANRSYLMIHWPDELVDDSFERIESEADRFGVGLITFTDPKKWDSYDIRLEAEHKVPDPANVDSFLVQLTKEKQDEIRSKI